MDRATMGADQIIVYSEEVNETQNDLTLQEGEVGNS